MKARFEIFTAVKNQVEIFWVVTLCSVVVGPLKCWCPTTTLHGVTTQKTSIRNPSISTLQHSNNKQNKKVLHIYQLKITFSQKKPPPLNEQEVDLHS
jgi:hypothetical protein